MIELEEEKLNLLISSSPTNDIYLLTLCSQQARDIVTPNKYLAGVHKDGEHKKIFSAELEPVVSQSNFYKHSTADMTDHQIPSPEQQDTCPNYSSPPDKSPTSASSPDTSPTQTSSPDSETARTSSPDTDTARTSSPDTDNTAKPPKSNRYAAVVMLNEANVTDSGSNPSIDLLEDLFRLSDESL